MFAESKKMTIFKEKSKQDESSISVQTSLELCSRKDIPHPAFTLLNPNRI